ncbi:MAG: hypothetical protein WC635_01170 [Bacteriovorax sp.]|jgi:hypothetical protein
MKEIESFAYKLNRLGGKNTYKQSLVSDVTITPFIDLEIFILEASRVFSHFDSRLYMTFAYWLKEFGHLISPSKLQKLIKSKKIAYDPQVLLGIIYFIQVYSDIELVNRNKGNGFQSVIKLCHKKFNERKIFDYPGRFENDPTWGKAKIQLPQFKFDPEHNYLNSKKRIFESVKEIKYRMMGLSANQAETLICIENKIFSPTEVSKMTLSDYGNSYRRLKLFEFLK